MQTKLLRTLAALPLAAAGAFLFADSAKAAFTVTLTDTGSGATTTITDDGAGDDSNSTTGLINTGQLTVGGFTTSFNIATSKPQTGTAANPFVSITNLTTTSTSTGNLKIEVTDTDFTPPPTGFQTQVANAVPGSGNLTFTSFIEGVKLSEFNNDFANNAFSDGETKGFPASVTNDPYSITLEALVSHTGATTTGFNGSIQAVPEPFTVMGSLMALGFGVYSKRKFKVSTENQNS